MLPFFKIGFLFWILTSTYNGAAQSQAMFPQNSYIEGFELEQKKGYTLLSIKNPNKSQGQKIQSFALVHRDSTQLRKSIAPLYTHIIDIPVKRMVVSSTTHLAAIELLNGQESVVGFPGTQYISSEVFRERIGKGELTDIGSDQSLNIERLLVLEPSLFIGYTVGEENRSYQTIRKSGIPIILNHDWLSTHPLSRAAWIYFFGALLDKNKEADLVFSSIKNEYEKIKNLAQQAKNKPIVMSGAMYKDVWYAPGGASWGAQFITDAKATYSFPSKNTSSDSYSLEHVLGLSEAATFWIGPGQFTSYQDLAASSTHYEQFTPFRLKNIFTYAAKKGATGGVLYYELAPQRPDLVLKDLVYIFHPELLPNHQLHFFSPLNP